jgi:hypothetical protein
MFLWVVTALFAAGQGVLLIGAARSQGDVVAPADFIGSLVVAVALASFGGLIALRGDSARYGWGPPIPPSSWPGSTACTW